MKKLITILLMTFLCSLLYCSFAFADEENGIYNVSTKDSGVVLTPQLADGTALEAEAAVVGTENVDDYYQGAVRMGLTYSDDVVQGSEYLVMVLKGDEVSPSTDTIVYIDQKTADSATLTYNLYPSSLEDGASYHVYLSSNAEDLEGLTEIAAFQCGKGIEDIAVTEISLDKETVTIPSGSTQQLTATIEPEEATNPNVIWSSSNPTVATVDQNGVVTANVYGSTVITATAEADANISASCTVNVLFSDVTGSYYFDPVYWAAANGITTGYEGGKYFGVGMNCTRQDLMIFIWRFAGCPTGYGDAREMFNDVTRGPSTAANKAIAWGYTTGLVKGYGDGGFHPLSPITRKDVLIILYRLCGKPAVSGTITFPDVIAKGYKTTSDSYKAILWGVNAGITKGYSSGEYAGQFGVDLDCLREQIVTFLYRYYNIYGFANLTSLLSAEVYEEPEETAPEREYLDVRIAGLSAGSEFEGYYYNAEDFEEDKEVEDILKEAFRNGYKAFMIDLKSGYMEADHLTVALDNMETGSDWALYHILTAEEVYARMVNLAAIEGLDKEEIEALDSYVNINTIYKKTVALTDEEGNVTYQDVYFEEVPYDVFTDYKSVVFDITGLNTFVFAEEITEEMVEYNLVAVIYEYEEPAEEETEEETEAATTEETVAETEEPTTEAPEEPIVTEPEVPGNDYEEPATQAPEEPIVTEPEVPGDNYEEPTTQAPEEPIVTEPEVPGDNYEEPTTQAPEEPIVVDPEVPGDNYEEPGEVPADSYVEP